MSKFGRRRRQRKKLQKEQGKVLELYRRHVTECLSKPITVEGKVGKFNLNLPTHNFYPRILSYGYWSAHQCNRCGLKYKTGGGLPGHIRIKFFGVVQAEPDAITLLAMTLKTSCSG